MRVGIIGGGPGGLFTAWMLRRKCGDACTVTVFESSDRAGGMLDTRWFEKARVPYEAGIAEIYVYPGVHKDPLIELLRELNIRTVPMRGRSVVIDGVTVRSTHDIGRQFGAATEAAVQTFLSRATDLLSVERWRRTCGCVHPTDLPAQRTHADLLHEIDDPAARRYLRSLTHADLAAEPHHTNAATAIDNVVMNLPGYVDFHMVPDGMSSIVNRLLSRLSSSIELGARVVRVDAIEGGICRIHFFRDGLTQVRDFDAVIVALPALSASTIDWRGEALERAMDSHIARSDVPGHYLRVSLLFDRSPRSEELRDHVVTCDAFGGSAVYDESLRFGVRRHTALGVLLAGNHAVCLGNADDATIVRQVLESLPPSLRPDPTARLMEGRVHRRAGLVCGRPGSAISDPVSNHRPVPELPRFLLVGNYQFDATLNGVCLSADFATTMLVRSMRDRPRIHCRVSRGRAPAFDGASRRVTLPAGPSVTRGT